MDERGMPKVACLGKLVGTAEKGTGLHQAGVDSNCSAISHIHQRSVDNNVRKAT
jgi:hypothetical protein